MSIKKKKKKTVYLPTYNMSISRRDVRMYDNLIVTIITRLFLVPIIILVENDL